jgi:hypothetical protein
VDADKHYFSIDSSHHLDTVFKYNNRRHGHAAKNNEAIDDVFYLDLSALADP